MAVFLLILFLLVVFDFQTGNGFMRWCLRTSPYLGHVSVSASISVSVIAPVIASFSASVIGFVSVTFYRMLIRSL